MNILNRIFKNNITRYTAVLVVGLLLGWMIFGGTASHQHSEDSSEQTAEPTVWTCSMHPQIKMDKMGKCPLCAMDLIPLKSAQGGDEHIDDQAIIMSKEAIALANIQTTVIGQSDAVKDILLYGTIQVDERLQQSQTAHVNGRIEQLYVNFTGESVKQGQLIATIYSPDLLTAQQELLEAAKLQHVQPLLLDAAKQKLRIWKMSDSQINKILTSGSASPYVSVHANTSGIVVTKNVNQGDYISQGSVLYTLSNLSKLWAVFEVYESDLPFIKEGDLLEYTLQSVPGEVFKGKVAFINPMIDPTSRTAKIRVETDNKGNYLKPEMYASAKIAAPVKQEAKGLVIPKSAVLWTGKRSVVYVKTPNIETPAFRLREIILGPSLGDSYIVSGGLNEGEEIVTHGVFIVDSSAQLEGKESMMNLDSTPPIEQANLEQATLTVKGNCTLCKERIETAVKKGNGIARAEWDVDTKVLQLTFDKKTTSVKAISKNIAKAGHDTALDQASEEDYLDLHSCCKYER